MFPPLSCLFLLFSVPLCFPFGKLPLSFHTLEKRSYLREQETCQGFHFVIGRPRAVGMETGSDICRLMTMRVMFPLGVITEILKSLHSLKLSSINGFFRAKMQLGFTGRIRFVAVPRIPLTVSISHALSA